MSAEFLSVFAAEGERIGWINAAGDHAYERFVVVRLGSLNLFDFEHIRRPIFVSNRGWHVWLLVSACRGEKNDAGAGKTQKTESRSSELHDVTFARDRSLCELEILRRSYLRASMKICQRVTLSSLRIPRSNQGSFSRFLRTSFSLSALTISS